MKKALLVVLLVIIAAVAAPFVNGLMMEKYLYSQLERAVEINEGKPLSPKVEILRYDRGYASSEIEWSIVIPQLEAMTEVGPIILVEQAKHGILGVSSTTSLEKNSWFNDFVQNELGGNNPLSISSSYNYFSGGAATIAVEPFELPLDEEDRLFVNPGEILIATGSNLETIMISGHFDGLSVPGKAEFSGIDLDSNMKLISRVIMAGETSFTVDQVDIKNEGTDVAVSMSAFKANSIIDYDEATNKMSLTASYSVAEVGDEEETFEDIRFSLSLKQIDAEALENAYNIYLDAMGDLLAGAQSGQDSSGMQMQLGMLGLQLMPEVEKMLQKDLEIAVDDVHARLPMGEIDGDLTIRLKKDMTLAAFMSLYQQPQQLVDVFSFSSHMILPKGLVPNEGNLLVPVLPGMQTGLFEAGEQQLTHSAEIKDDKLMLNGKEFMLSF